ncbi:MAG: SDR family oxidoreductase [Ilumatobacter sp.]|uniref:SDR family NAD(P)-dependent oxidoreductase n=1 Tax=Ilumatobacter sp. TaxID=1967498 RepID=UPI00262B60DA|nr:SDR family oxidoreductase [Ilumatobacter sp.]MDJ0770717.1 SDR family oxidoreductase [Ilumatobacter sp.]
MEIDGTTWVVTGASAGIGEAITHEARRRGVTVIGVARREGVEVRADLADPEVVEGLVERIEEEHGPIDVWVNNAGVDARGPFLDASADDVRAIQQINLATPIELCRQVIPRMVRRNGGHVVNVSSMASVAAFPGIVLYGSTKAGLSAFHRVLRTELGRSPVGLTIVEIGPSPTDMLDRAYAHPPTEHGFRRLRRLLVLPEVDRVRVATEVVDAVEAGRAAVRLPRRIAPAAWVVSVPQRLVDLLTLDRPDAAAR